MQIRRVTQNEDRGPYQATRHPYRHSFHGHSPFLRYDHIQVEIPPSTGSSGLSTGSSVFLQETSCRVFGRPRTDCVEDLKPVVQYGGMQANVFLHHPLLSPPSTTPACHAMEIPAQSNQNVEFSEEAILKWNKGCRGPMRYLSKPSEDPATVTVIPPFRHAP